MLYTYRVIRSVSDGLCNNLTEACIAVLGLFATLQQQAISRPNGQRGDLRQTLRTTLENNQQHTYST